MNQFRVERWFYGQTGEHVVMVEGSNMLVARFSDAPDGAWAGWHAAIACAQALEDLEYWQWKIKRLPTHAGCQYWEAKAEIDRLQRLLPWYTLPDEEV